MTPLERLRGIRADVIGARGSLGHLVRQHVEADTEKGGIIYEINFSLHTMREKIILVINKTANMLSTYINMMGTTDW